MLRALKHYRKYLGLSTYPTLNEQTPLVAKLKGKGPVTSTRQIRRLVQDCFDAAYEKMKEDGLEPGIGYQGIRIMSMDMLLKSADTPVMWTDEDDATASWVSIMESTATRELMADTNWGELDYLLIDMPPGSDRIDNIRSLIPELAGVVEITIPSPLSQHIVTKSITKNNKMGVPIIGLIENMATYICPHCEKEGKLFEGEDVHKLTERKEIPYIGKIPFDPRVSQTSQSGSLFYTEFKDSVTGKAIAEAVDNIEKFITK